LYHSGQQMSNSIGLGGLDRRNASGISPRIKQGIEVGNRHPTEERVPDGVAPASGLTLRALRRTLHAGPEVSRTPTARASGLACPSSQRGRLEPLREGLVNSARRGE
jgi:hypothetical protein